MGRASVTSRSPRAKLAPMNAPRRDRIGRYVRQNPDDGGSATTVVLAVGGIAVLGVVGYLIYRATQAQAAAPPAPVGPGAPRPSPLPSTQTHGVPPAPSPPAVTPSRIEQARTTPAATFLVVRDREEDLTPDQLANYVAAMKVMVMYTRSRSAASGRPPNAFTGEFRHDIEMWHNTLSGQAAIRYGDRFGRLDRETQQEFQQTLADAQEALANGDWNRPWPT